MNTSKLKTFAQSSRRLLMEGVARRITWLGFDEKGKIIDEPVEVPGGMIIRGEVIDDPSLMAKWNSLRTAIRNYGLDTVTEEGAYTWFNRMLAIQVLAKNGYDVPQLEYETDQVTIPVILSRARRGIYDFLNRQEQNRLKPLLSDFSLEQKAFAILLTGYCHHHHLLNKVFGRLDDYTELLLPDNILSREGFLYLLNTTDAISEEDYKQVELIGWLYQFYISEKKDQVFAAFKQNKKAEAKDIPAATQIFTPNWIVKYMVQNTVGRIWLDQHPASPLRQKMKYLVEPHEDSSTDTKEHITADRLEKREVSDILQIEELTELKLLDPACGSGHILVEGFYHLFDMYMEEYFLPDEAVEKIFQHNLYGLDIDLRAVQLAQFAVLLAAATKYPGILKSHIQPHIYAMPEPVTFSRQEILDFLGSDGMQHEKVLTNALELMQQAKNLGSVMQFKMTAQERQFYTNRLEILNTNSQGSLIAQTLFNKILPFMQIMFVMTDRYEAIAANPPYMGQKNMNNELKDYVNNQFPISKSDLFSVFIEVMTRLLKKCGHMGCITMESWMFLTSFENLRLKILTEYKINSLSHFGWYILQIAFGTVAFILQNRKATSFDKSVYSYLEIEDIDREKEIPFEFPKMDNGRFSVLQQSEFSKIPGSPIAYWVSQQTLNLFQNFKTVKDIFDIKQGLATCNNELFVRYWFEVSNYRTGYNLDENIAKLSNYKWFPYNKGGGFRKWYGLNQFVVNWYNGGIDIHNYNNLPITFSGAPVRAKQYYFKQGLTYNLISSGGKFASRYIEKGYIFDVGGSMIFSENIENLKSLLLFTNTKLSSFFLEIINPTFNFQVGDIGRIPFIDIEIKSEINTFYRFSKEDWDSHEISWDFSEFPILKFIQHDSNWDKSLEENFKDWEKSATDVFYQLHSMEEELNRFFISIYGLNFELDPIISLKDITILEEEIDYSALEETEISLRERRKWIIDDGNWILYIDNLPQTGFSFDKLQKSIVKPLLPIKKNVVMQQLISYAMGCMMGRFSLDAPGLIMANQGESLSDYFKIVKKKIAKLEPDKEFNQNDLKFMPDEDGIVPLMGSNGGFADDAHYRFRHFLEVVWGSETLTQNLNFLQSCLETDLEKYLTDSFWKDHCSRYKKKPIYWLFSSKKGAFQVLVYMHRMNRFSVQKIRDNYLLKHLQWLNNQISQLGNRESMLGRIEAKRLDYLRLALRECEEYDLHLKSLADRQIEFDLDDGVTVNYEKFRPVVAEIK